MLVFIKLQCDRFCQQFYVTLREERKEKKDINKQSKASLLRLSLLVLSGFFICHLIFRYHYLWRRRFRCFFVLASFFLSE